MRFSNSLVLVGLLAAAGTAAADSKVEVLDRGNAVEVIAHDMKALKTDINTVRSRLEVPVSGGTLTQGQYSNDKTVKLIELTGHGTQKNLSVKLAYEHDGVLALSKQSQVIQVGNDLHIIVPRVLPAIGAKTDLPEPTLTPELAAKAAAIAPVPTKSEEVTHPVAEPKQPEAPKAVEAPKTETKAPEAIAPIAATTAIKADAPKTETVAAAPKAEAKPAEKTPEKKDDKKIAGATEPSPMKSFPMMLAVILAGLGCFAWSKRKKTKPSEKTSSIEVIAQKSLGGKAKIVWVQAGGRDIVVAVTPNAVTTLGNWKKSATNQNDVGPLTAALPEMTALGIAPNEKTERKSSSPAVAGLLKLRARTNVPHVNEDVATDDSDADAIWAKEILAATGARR
ncbi:MAG TPA: flagellar biosynthetic protein FliO [Kofleriaceae bacterium]|jgi:flagellar biogenesis protein FliO